MLTASSRADAVSKHADASMTLTEAKTREWKFYTAESEATYDTNVCFGSKPVVASLGENRIIDRMRPRTALLDVAPDHAVSSNDRLAMPRFSPSGH